MIEANRPGAGLIERSAALAELDGWLGDARAGQGRLVLVGGEAGVGKTSLVNEFAGGQRGATRSGAPRVLWSACDALSTPQPLGPMYDLAPVLGGRVQALLSDEHPPREAVFADLLAELGRSGVESILVVEDLHWADEATLDLLRFLTRRIARAPVLILGTYRDDELSPTHPLRLLLGDLANAATVRRLRLEPLSRNAVATLAGPSGIDPEHLYTITGGNPFYVTEVLATGQSDIPATVRDAVLARAARLSAPARQALDAAAVVTPPVETWLLAEVAGCGPEQLDECVSAGMLRARPGGVEFHHELARLAISRAVPPARHSELHRRSLAALLARPHTTHDSTRLAHHAEGAGDAAAVLAHAVPAARWAAALGAHRVAGDQYGRALRFAAGLPPRELADLLERHAFECYLTNRAHEAVASQRRALDCWRAVGDPLRQGDSLRWLSRLAWFCGDNVEAERSAHEAVTLLRRLPPGPELAMAYSNLAQLRMLCDDAASTVHWGQLAIDLAESLGRNDILAHALNNVGTVEIFTDPPSGRAKLIRSLELAKAEGMEEHVARALNNIAEITVSIHDFGQAERWLAEGLAYCTQRDLDSWRVSLLAVRAGWHLNQGRWAAAVQDAQEVLRDPRAVPVARGQALEVTGQVRAWRGEPDGWPVLDEALALANATGEPPRWISVMAARAEAAWLAGDPGRARDVAQEALAPLAPGGDGAGGWASAELAYWCGRLGQPTVAAPDAPAPFLAQLAGDWVAAAALWRELGCPYEAACALAETGQDADMRAAHTELRRLGAQPAAAMVSRRLREMGARGLSRGPSAATRGNPAWW